MLQLGKHAIIAGSTKCGTTSLFQYLSVHPQICASLVKETRFFWEGEYGLPKPLLNNKDVKNYNDFFSECTENKIKLEATPDYLYSPLTAQKIKREIPQCKIVFILRTPQERIISWYKYAKQRGYLSAQLTLDGYIKLLKEADAANCPQYLKALEQGRYGYYLRHYLTLFGKEKIFISFHKNLQSNPKAFMFSLCDFLEIDKSCYNNFDFKIYNPSLNVKSVSGLKKYIRFKKLLRSYNNRLPQGLRKFFKKALKPVDTIYLNNKTEKWNEINISSQDKIFLSEYYREDHLMLEELLNKKIIW
jgi:hypothetical protein